MEKDVRIVDDHIDGYLSIRELAEKTGSDPNMLRTWYNRGKLKAAFKIGTSPFFDEDTVVPDKWDDIRRRRKHGNETD